MKAETPGSLLTDNQLREMAVGISSQMIEIGLLDLGAGVLIGLRAYHALTDFPPLLLWLVGVAFIGPLSRGWGQFLARIHYGLKLPMVRWPTRFALLNALLVLLALAAVLAAEVVYSDSRLSSWSVARSLTTGMLDPLLTVVALAIAGLLTPCRRFYYYALLTLIAAPLAWALGFHQQYGVLAVAAIMLIYAVWHIFEFQRRRRALPAQTDDQDSPDEAPDGGAK